MHCEFLSLHISSLHVLLWPADDMDTLSDGLQGIRVNGLDLIPTTELALQDLSYPFTRSWSIGLLCVRLELISVPTLCGYLTAGVQAYTE